MITGDGLTWRCWNERDTNEIVRLTAQLGGETWGSGAITVAGITHQAKFQFAGFERRWEFGLDDGRYQYAFVIRPSGRGGYYIPSVNEEGVINLRARYRCQSP